MDTRTPTRPQGGRAEGPDGELALNTVRIPTDPARLSSTTASFRVRLGAPVSPLIDSVAAAPAFAAPRNAGVGSGYRSGIGAGPEDTQPLLVLPALVSVGAAGAGGRGAAAAPGGGEGRPRRRARVTPITWTGEAAPLLDAVLVGGPGGSVLDDGTRVLPAQQSGAGSRGILGGTQLMPRYQPGPEPQLDEDEPITPYRPGGADADGQSYLPGEREPGEPVRHAWYPGRRVDLGLVLLPLRLFLGGISIYAGFSKLCDPVYFDGGARGSMMHWLQGLHPWASAQPLLHLALNHPVGAGLGVAFVQIVVGVLSVVGLWQRLAAAVAMLLAVSLLVTVSWRTAPAYDAPEIIYLAAWSPLLLAGAPLFSLDGRLAIEAWRRLGERSSVSALRRRVLRRGIVVATVVVGATLLLGSALGAAVRSGRLESTVTPDSPGAVPTDYPSPQWPSLSPSAQAALPKPSASHSASPSASASATRRPSSRHSGSGSPSSGSSSGHHSGSPSSAPSQRHGGSPSSAPSSGNGVIGGLLGGATPLPLLGLALRRTVVTPVPATEPAPAPGPTA
ncbi:DoxX family membrane protein [Streptacidiphilus sp. EB129]|uniref:DoxX family membrane protein n=1 Tax=Streptacidiphilus sp. EB129 TaxID=3156262 RepID=UPI0035140295